MRRKHGDPDQLGEGAGAEATVSHAVSSVTIDSTGSVASSSVETLGSVASSSDTSTLGSVSSSQSVSNQSSSQSADSQDSGVESLIESVKKVTQFFQTEEGEIFRRRRDRAILRKRCSQPADMNPDEFFDEIRKILDKVPKVDGLSKDGRGDVSQAVSGDISNSEGVAVSERSAIVSDSKPVSIVSDN